MAFEIGVASDHVDLWDKLLAFLTTNPDLVATGQNWSIGWQAPVGAPNETDCVVVGPGMGGTDQIYVGLRRVESSATNRYLMMLCGNTGIMPSDSAYNQHVNPSTTVGVYLDAAPMKYWFTANGRRFAAVVRVGSVYESLYAGLFLPYANPLQYSYPLFIGGSVTRALAGDVDRNWTNTDNQHRDYTNSAGNHTSFFDRDKYSSSYMFGPAAEWKQVTYDNAPSSAALAPKSSYKGLATNMGEDIGSGFLSQLAKTRECLGGGFSLEPLTLWSADPTIQTYGVLDGVYHVGSETNYSENLITIGGVDHVVFPNIWRVGSRYLSALALE